MAVVLSIDIFWNHTEFGNACHCGPFSAKSKLLAILNLYSAGSGWSLLKVWGHTLLVRLTAV